MQVARLSTPLTTNRANAKRNIEKRNYVSFNAKAATKAPSAIQEAMANFIAKYIIETGPVGWVISKTKGKKNIQEHLTALTSVVLSAFYMQKTLDNKNLDPQRKKTLAINQGATWVVSTGLSYALSSATNKNIDKFAETFAKMNPGQPSKSIEKWKTGIKAAAPLMIFGLMFRFFAPVVVTPIANHLGNKLEEKNKAEKLGKKQSD